MTDVRVLALAALLLVATGLRMPAARAQETPPPPPAPVPTLPPDPLRRDTIRVEVPRRLPALRLDPDRVDAAVEAAARRGRRAVRRRRARQPLDPVAFRRLAYGTALLDSLPIRTRFIDMGEIVAEAPGAFVYDLGAEGWPDGVSLRGFAPHRADVFFNGHPFRDPFTGRPRLDLLPPEYLAVPRLGPSRTGTAPVALYTQVRAYDVRRPLTEIRYRRDNFSMQGVTVTHTQQRRLNLLGFPGLLQVTGGFGGRATDNAYPNDDLRVQRRLFARALYRQNDWSVEVYDLASRHRMGAHGGVQVPTGAPFDVVYNAPLADVQRSRARRQTIRNDLGVILRAPLLAPLLPSATPPAPDSVRADPAPARPEGTTRAPAATEDQTRDGRPLTTVSAAWTEHSFRYRDPSVTDRVVEDGPNERLSAGLKMNAFHGRVEQPVIVRAPARLGGTRHDVLVTLAGTLARRQASRAMGPAATRYDAHLAVRDSTALGPARLVATGGLHATSEVAFVPSANVRATVPLGRVGPLRRLAAFGHVRRAEQARPWMATDGFRGLVLPLPPGDRDRDGAVVEIEAGARGHLATPLGPLDLRLSAFAHQISDALDFVATDADTTIQAVVADAPVRRAGATLAVGLRRDARRGLYLTTEVTATELLSASAHPRRQGVLPQAFGSATLGARVLLFRRDLDLDAFVRVRGWSRVRSRVFHAPTGLFALPQPPPPEVAGTAADVGAFGPDGVLDVWLEGRIRGATIYVGYLNALSGTNVQPGVTVVPVYPLLAQQFRIGVFWPILN